MADPPAVGDEIALPPADSHHLARVVRRRPGDGVELIDGLGGLWPAEVLALGPPVVLRVIGERAGRPPAPVVLCQGLADWGRIDTLVEKAVELGVAEIVLMDSERARRVPDPDAWRRRRERLGRVAESAARQSGQAWRASIRGLVPFDRIVAEIPTGQGFLLDPRGAVALPDALAGRPPGAGPATLLIGPEAGFSDDELGRAGEAGVTVCGLGPTVLRSETAAIAALTLVLAASGRFGGPGQEPA